MVITSPIIQFHSQTHQGILNPADYCSRHITNNQKVRNCENKTEQYVNFTSHYAAASTTTLEEIGQHKQSDLTLQLLTSLIRSNKWDILKHPDKLSKHCNLKDLKVYQNIANELTILSDKNIILRGNRIIIPQSLQQRMIKFAHTGHLGMTKSKSILRDKIYFPGLDVLLKAH